jgi:Domain of unknown function (DUF5667)
MSEAQRLEALAERLRAVEPVKPSPAAKIRGWNLTLAAVQQSATVRSRGHSVRRLVLAAAAAAILVVVGAVAASADSLPDSPLYPVKSAAEQARGLLAFSPTDKLTYHLDLAETRLREAEAMIARHRVDLAEQALAQLNGQLDEAAQLVSAVEQTDPLLAADLENRLQQAVDVHDRQLAGLQGQVTNPTALAAIAAARDRAAQAVQQANNSTSGNQGTGSTGKGQGSGPSATPHPTSKK